MEKKLYIRLQATKHPTHVRLADPDEYYRVRVGEVTVPYVKGKGIALPDVDPFNISIPLSGDDGMTLETMYVLPNGNIKYFYNTELELDEGRVHIERSLGPEQLVLDIRLLDD